MTIRIDGPARRRDGPHIDRRALRSQAGRVLKALGREHGELSIRLLDDTAMAQLNRDFRAEDGTTDVLSFSLLEGAYSQFRGPLLGEVAIGVETAARQARRTRRSVDEEILWLLIHGVLHLLGYDHELPEQARVMRRIHLRLWRSLHP